MKIAVHPLVVAAALGLIGPAALAEDDTEETAELAAIAPSTVQAIDPDEQERIARLWFEAREALDRT